MATVAVLPIKFGTDVRNSVRICRTRVRKAKLFTFKGDHIVPNITRVDIFLWRKETLLQQTERIIFFIWWVWVYMDVFWRYISHGGYIWNLEIVSMLSEPFQNGNFQRKEFPLSTCFHLKRTEPCEMRRLIQG